MQCKVNCCRRFAPASHRRVTRRLLNHRYAAYAVHHTVSAAPLTLIPLFVRGHWLKRSSSLYLITNNHSKKPLASSPMAAAYSAPSDDSDKQAKIAQVSKRLESTSRYFKRLGSFGFWSQLVATVVSAVILSFSIIVSDRITSRFTFYSIAGSTSAAFISVFWSFGYIRLSEKLRKMASDPSKAPSRAYVVRSLRNGIGLNLLGVGAAILGMLATVGLLVAKALTTSAAPYYQGIYKHYTGTFSRTIMLIGAIALGYIASF